MRVTPNGGSLFGLPSKPQNDAVKNSPTRNPGQHFDEELATGTTMSEPKHGLVFDLDSWTVLNLG